MSIRAMILGGLLGFPLLAGAALAADTSDPSLADAARQGDRDGVRALLMGRGKDAVPGPEGTDALIWAVSRHDLEMADLLLGAGVNVKGANEYGATALYAAAENADSAMIEKLLAAGAEANTHLLSGETPLMQLARQGNLATARLLLASGADPNAREINGGQNALMWAIAQRHSAVAAELVQHGADINARSKSGFTALMFAAQQGDADSARMLLAAGASPNDVMPRSGLTPLLVASAMGRTKVAALLVDKGADPNVVAANGFTPLHYAARRKASVAIVSALLAHGAKPNVRLNQKKPSETPNGVSLQGATPLALAADVNNFEAVKLLADSGADLLIATEHDTTPLMLAAGAGTDVVRSRSPAERAVAIQTVAFLVEHGADVNAAGQYGWTALHSAAYQGLNDVVEFLVSKGARLDARDGFGQTPLSISNTLLTKEVLTHGYQAPRIFRRDTAELLLKLGATPLDRSGVVGVVQRVITE